MSARRTAVVVCPGRGTYNKAELGYLARHHAARSSLVHRMDERRAALGQDTLSALDGASTFFVSRYSRGDNASALIHACSWLDFLAIDRDAFDIVAVTGNSMGWYIALACAGALDGDGGFEVVNNMGTLMQDNLTGGQVVQPFVDGDWRAIEGERERLLAIAADIAARPDHAASVSIELGGMIVFAGNDKGIVALERELPPREQRFPMRLANHAAFHSPLLEHVAGMGREKLPQSLFCGPDLPLVDGRGSVWYPRASDPAALRDYTLGHQVVRPYDFTRAIVTAAREFAPDLFIVTGPGATLGGAVAQALISANWRGLSSRADFQARQAGDPVLLSMGMDDQRALAVGG
jgi:[acyl-carrier-protein] S-malonyltransferase